MFVTTISGAPCKLMEDKGTLAEAAPIESGRTTGGAMPEVTSLMEKVRVMIEDREHRERVIAEDRDRRK